MKLTEVFSSLAYGELSQVVLGSHVDGVIPEAHYPALVNHINLGLTSLHKRFTLKEGRLTLLLQPGRMSYPLTSAFATATLGSREPVRHIEDSASEPFRSDILKVERVYTDSGWELGLNDIEDVYACATPGYNLLRVPTQIVSQSVDLPDHLKTAKLLVVYRASHPAIVIETGYFFPDEVEVELPESHLQALLYFVASRVHNPIGMSNEFHAGNSWFAKYEMECQRLEEENLQIDQGSGNTRLERNGWV